MPRTSTTLGDSILGRDVNLGAGVILSNYRLDGQVIRVQKEGHLIETGLRKFGRDCGRSCLSRLQCCAKSRQLGCSSR